MIKAIFFDLDNTLVDRQLSAYIKYHEIVAECLPLIDDAFEKENIVQELMLWDEFGNVDKKYVYTNFCNKYALDVNLVNFLVQDWVDTFGEYVIKFTNVDEILKSLKKHYYLGVITNGSSITQHRKLEKSGLKQYFDSIIVSGDININKPDPKIFEYALQQSNFKPNEVVFVGDIFCTDIIGAHRAKLTPIMIKSDLRKPIMNGIITIESIDMLEGIVGKL